VNLFISIGLPNTGKTTFLAALWHVLESREVDGALWQRGLQADREYLNKIRDAWIAFEQVPRTETPVGGVTFDLADPVGSAAGRIEFPDLPGESFRSQWTDRHWSEEFDQRVRAATGILLFVAPTLHDSRLIMEADSRLPGSTSADGASTTPPAEVAWKAKHAPTQAQVVELLQFLTNAREPGTPIPLALVVSAWDQAERFAAYDSGADPAPVDWIEARMPLLWQYLRANAECFRWRAYGISAQGGDLDEEDDVTRMQEYAVTSHRIRVVEADGESHDPTRPLRWLLECAGSEM
jgi:hypothetical protein